MQSNKQQRRSHSGIHCSINAVSMCASEDSTNDNSSVELLGNGRSDENGDIDGTLSLSDEHQDEDSIGADAMHENDVVALPVSFSPLPAAAIAGEQKREHTRNRLGCRISRCFSALSGKCWFLAG